MDSFSDGLSASLCLWVFVNFLQLAGGQLSHTVRAPYSPGLTGFPLPIPAPAPLISASGSCQGQGGARGGSLVKKSVGALGFLRTLGQRQMLAQAAQWL